MKRRRGALTAAALGAALALGPAATAHADVPVGSYGKYLTLSGPNGLIVGGDWGTWTITAKNPTNAENKANHLLFNAWPVRATDQLQLQIRTGTSGPWKAAPVRWTQEGTAADHVYIGSFEFGSAPLDLKPHQNASFQVRARMTASHSTIEPFDTGFSAFLTPQPAADGQAGNFFVRADTSVAPEGLSTSINGLPTSIPADGKTRLFTINVSSADQVDWHLTKAGFFLWQGPTYGSMQGPKPCDAEVDVWDPRARQWHRVQLGALGMLQDDVDLVHWATGPGYNRTITARITLGAGFRATGTGRGGASLGFGYFPGSGEPDYFWTMHPLTSTPVAGAPACVKPSSPAPAPVPVNSTTSPSPVSVASTAAAAPSGAALAATGGGSGTGLLAGLGAALLAVGGAAMYLVRRRGRRA